MPKPESKKSERATENFLICITKELKKKVKQEAHRMFGNRKGAESLYVEMIMRNHLKMNIDGVEET